MLVLAYLLVVVAAQSFTMLVMLAQLALRGALLVAARRLHPRDIDRAEARAAPGEPGRQAAALTPAAPGYGACAARVIRLTHRARALHAR